MSLIDTGYRRWMGESTGVWTRRWVVVRTGMRLCLRSKILRAIIMFSWSMTLGMTGVFFFFGQLMAPDSSLLTWIGENGGQRATDVINGLTAWFMLYPDVCVDGLYKGVMLLGLNVYLSLTFFAVMLFIPKLIAQDLSSNAIVIYNSKALTRLDYLLGKFGVVFGVLMLLWIMPVIASWAIGNLMAPYWSFFYHSLPALGIALGVGIIGATALSLIALAISALAKRSSVAVAFWTIGWIATSLFAQAVGQIHDWGYYLSPSRCVSSLGNSLFNLLGVLEDARNMLPFFNVFSKMTNGADDFTTEIFEVAPVWQPAMFLIGYSLIALAIISRRVRPE